MLGYLQILVFVIFGIALLWFGFNLFIGQWAKIRTAVKEYDNGHRNNKDGKIQKQQSSDGSAFPVDPQACPICSTKLNRGELVKTHAFPSVTGGVDRLMHILGCAYCVEGDLERKCPVCGKFVGKNEFLVARIFERSHRRNHVHILGCIHCRRR